MSTFVSLINWTEQGIRTLKDSPKRLDAARKTLKEMGGELEAFYMTQGSLDAILIFEAPSDEVAAKFLLKVGSAGNIRTTTLKAYPEADYRKIIGALSLRSAPTRRPHGRVVAGLLPHGRLAFRR